MAEKGKTEKRIIVIVFAAVFFLSYGALLAAEVFMMRSDDIRAYTPVHERAYTELPAAQKSVSLIDAMPDMPDDFVLIDWQEKAEGFHNLAFSEDLTDEQNFLPLFRVDDVNGKRIGTMPAFVGLKEEQDRPPNGYSTANSEAVTFVNAVLSGSLIGIDMSDVYGEDYVSMCLQFINREGVLTNWLGAASAVTSMWYMQFSTLQLFALADLYPGLTELQKSVRIIADKYYEALKVLGGGSDAGLDMSIQSFDFAAMQPVKQMAGAGSWYERDSAVTIGLMMYWAYRHWGDDKFLESSLWCADYIDAYEGNAQYEIAYVYCPYFFAMLNAEVGTDYDISKQFEKILSTDSDARSGWGYTNVAMNTDDNPALYAVCQSNNPYYWYMNTVEGAAAFMPMVLYDQSYANAVGKYVLNAVNSSRYFFSDGPLKDRRNKDATVWESAYAKYVPFEAIHWMTDGGTQHIKNGNVPADADLYLSGDPVEENWDFQTEHSMYSGAATGKFGGTVQPTEVEGILRIDLSKQDYMREAPSYQTYLYYNPHGEDKKVTVELGYRFYDLYDSVSDAFIQKNATGSAELTIPAKNSVCLVMAAPNAVRRNIDGRIYLNDSLVAYRAV